MNVQNQNILFFDGVCGLCNNTVNVVMKANKTQPIKFAPLQGETAKQHLPISLREDLSSLVFISENQIHLKSGAVMEICNLLPYYRWLRIFRFVPGSLRDGIYDWIARNRYRWFGKKAQCRLPLVHERALFLP